MYKIIWMLCLNFSHFSTQFRHVIYQILIYGFKDMRYSILNVERENKLKIILFLFIQKYYYLIFAIYSHKYSKFKL